MISMWYNKKFFKITTGIILILLIVYLLIQVNPILNIVWTFVASILMPILIAGLLYYIFRPLHRILSRKMHPLISIALIFALILIAFSAIISFIWPLLIGQISEFTAAPQETLKAVESKTMDFMNFFTFTPMAHDDFKNLVYEYLQKLMLVISENLVFTLQSIAKIASYFVITPFMLFYFLKDDHLLKPKIMEVIPKNYKRTIGGILKDSDKALSGYITGQVMVAMIVGILIFIGYLIIGLNYAFVLALFAFMFNLIPFCGPLLSTLPALLIGLGDSPMMGIKVLIVVITVHLLDMNIVSPRIVGQRLRIHPLTIIVLLVCSFPIMGIIGLFIIVPLYAVLKIAVRDLYWNPPKEIEAD